MTDSNTDHSQFSVILKNLNYGVNSGIRVENQVFNHKKSGVAAENQVDETQKPGDSLTLNIDALPFNSQTKKSIAILFSHFNDGSAFSRKDIRELCNLTDSPAGDLLNKMKKTNLIIEAKENRRGKYKFFKDV